MWSGSLTRLCGKDDDWATIGVCGAEFRVSGFKFQENGPSKHFCFGSEQVADNYLPSYARFKPSISILSICSIACMTLFDFSASLSCNILPSTEGIICHERPYLSLSQPHLFFLPPAESFSQNSSTSCWVSHVTKNDMAGVKLNCGPPLSA